jgi:2,4-dienoyl-CoA reductase (NADPH2)
MRPGEEKYPHIFSPGKIGKLEAKNRIKYASTETNFCDRDGFVTDKEIAYMEAQAKGGTSATGMASSPTRKSPTWRHRPKAVLGL